MVGKFIVTWHTQPAPGCTYYSGTKRVTVNYDRTSEDPFVVAVRRAGRELAQVYGVSRIVFERVSQVSDWPVQEEA